MLHRPALRISIAIHGPQKTECNAQSYPKSHQESLSPCGIPQQHRSKAVANSHHCNPGNQRIRDQKTIAAETEDRLLMKGIPKPRPSPELCRLNWIQQIVT